MVDFGKGAIVDYADLLEEIICLVREGAERLDCVAEIETARSILKRGISAYRQVAVYDAAKTSGANEEEALHAVVDWLIEETVQGVV